MVLITQGGVVFQLFDHDGMCLVFSFVFPQEDADILFDHSCPWFVVVG